MKRLCVCLIVSLLLLFTGCGSYSDTEAPVFTGLPDRMSGTIFQEIDLLQGVAASDETDGDLTEEIRVAVLPLEQVHEGKFTPARTGEYVVLYKVSDKSANERTARIKLTVENDTQDARPLFKAYDCQGTMAGSAIDCYNHAEVGAKGEAAFVNGELVYTIEKFGAIDWYNKLTFGGLLLEPGKNYSFEFEAKSSVPVTFSLFVNINGGTWDPVCLSFVTLGEDYTKYSYSSSLIESSGEYAMFLQFGSETNQHLGKTVISFRSIRIYENEQ